MPKSIHSTTRLVTPHYLLNLIILNSDLKASLSIASGGGTGSQPPVRTIIITIIIVIIMMRVIIIVIITR